IAWSPTAQPRRDPTIWMAPSAGTNVGSMLDGVGVALADAEGEGVGVGVAVGESLADADALAVGGAVGLVADADVQPARTSTMALMAPSRAKGRGIVLQR